MRRHHDRWRINSEVRSMHSEDGAVLLDLGKGLCYRLNVVAARIWAVIEEKKTEISVARIADALEAQFDISRERLESDIAEYLGELAHFGAIDREN